MSKTILITGSTDGIGLETAKRLVEDGHEVLVHGRSSTKLDAVRQELESLGGGGEVAAYRADLSDLHAVVDMARQVAEDYPRLDVIINNAGVFRTADPITEEGLDLRFVVNVFAPVVLTAHLIPHMAPDGRIINLSSAAQAPVDPAALAGTVRLDDTSAYAQSKLAITMWSNHLAGLLGEGGPVVVSVNPGSFLGTKMVMEAYGTTGNDVSIGVDILVRGASSDEFGTASGRYYDNDSRRFAAPHPDALDPAKTRALSELIDGAVAAYLPAK